MHAPFDRWEIIGGFRDQKEDYLIDIGGKFFKKIGTKLSVGKIGQAYSVHVKKVDIPFKFEDKEIPSSISGRMVFNENMIF